ncbi:hypothetical protein CONCODRAFT_12072 [Conidiobolus coronatus NRRL 28638]|uniref:Uncharacterized protein n=1 Tax=Conidiobolus coronatus (strain ATCC 28846 / CBS 209.66 / NRRL 28638) TaxID=796925 RepID=A0A137NTN2_CONC2|nr:hypothetical protein CONCODRAFT_12072 [Conidiobolus coronatus NRRL 28638]|eukprot:KXN66153.1 hypothetical protein CONCODRAFT_12072 [Conidiobolus coronatus NRRL 28638]
MTSPSNINDLEAIDLPHILNSYFSHLTQLNPLASAKVTKELKSVVLGNFLIRFTNSEETYFSLEFLKPKRFRRENYLFHNYTSLADELRREINPLICNKENHFREKGFTSKNDLLPRQQTAVNDSIKPRLVPEDALSTSPTNAIRASQLYLSLCESLLSIIAIRQDLVNCFKLIYQNLNSSLFPIDQWEYQLEICKSKIISIQTPMPLKSFIRSIELEVYVCLYLVQSYKAILDFDLKTSIFKIFTSHHLYYQWKKLCFPKPQKSSSVNSPNPNSPSPSHSVEPHSAATSSLINTNTANIASFFQSLVDFNKPHSFQQKGRKVSNLMLWLEKLYDHVASKLTLYFQEGLVDFEKELGGETKALWRFTTPSLDYHHQFFQFRKRSGAHSTALIYLVQEMKEFRRKGFAGHSLPYIPPSGLESFPCIFCHPEEPPTDHWPNLISILLSNQLNAAAYLPPSPTLPGSPMGTDSDPLNNRPEPIPIIHFYDRKISITLRSQW